ncbi:MAG: tRNA (N(6)-L-threonylcarbamoyladenosine(37)-C(2))-methylthiotransferase MtaB [Bacteroidales bacterium]|nr:tRNA (N(6)-L-threonylcarbamoyladenosine(37)-C(2))-methylthiotransferase MtaB [Bacteroidales bacterium]
MIDTSIFQDKTVVFYTLGCKLNFAETSTLGQLLAEQGFRKARSGEQAHLCIINTCSVTELADKKCRQAIRRIARKHPDAFMVVTGCYAQLKPEDIADMPEVDLVLGAEQKLELLKYLPSLEKRSHGEVIVTPHKDIRLFSPSCSRGDRTRYFLKVQDGCDYYCTYCTIPLARGRSRSGTIEQIVSQARQVAEAGGKEIVITGVNIGDFGKHTPETFYDLIRALDEVDGIDRYRISSIEPDLLTDEIIDFVAQSKRFCPHFHIPLQSGSDEVLKLMRRHYDRALFAHKVERIKQAMPDAFIGVDLIAGMRGETEQLFEDSYNFIASLDVTQLHVFTYSERPNTRALGIEPVVDVHERHIRCNKLIELSNSKLQSFYRAHQNSVRPVLFEQPTKGMPMHGFTDNYIRVEMPYNREAINKVRLVRLGEFNEAGDALTAQYID